MSTSLSPIRKIADACAVIVHPLLLFVYGCTAMLWGDLGKGIGQAWLMYGCILLFSLGIPLLSVKLFGKDMFLKDRKTRFWPLVITLGSYILLAVVTGIFFQDSYAVVRMYAQIAALNLLVLLVVSIWYKISLHADGFGIWAMLFIIAYMVATSEGPGELPLLLSITLPILALFIFVMWQRVVSGSHTRMQVAAGFITGMALTAAYLAFLAEIF